MPRRIVAVVDDLFFASKIRGTAEQLGVTVSFPRTFDSLKEDLVANPPSLIICDLPSQRIDSIALAKQLKEDPRTSRIPLLGFFSHVQTEVQTTALEAGFNRVIPRSAFVRFLPEILAGTEST